MGGEENAIFTEIKQEWCKNLELTLPDFNKEFSLETDASDKAIGAVLRQENNPIAYISRSLKAAELNYSITERETLAALWAMEKLQYYLMGRKFKLITDHKALLQIKTKPEFGSKRVQRWFERLQMFDFEVVYKEGTQMIVSDSLSRSCGEIRHLEEDTKTQILQLHRNLQHRWNIIDKCKAIEPGIKYYELRGILKECEECAACSNFRKKKGSYIETNAVGELIGIDIMEYDSKWKVIVAIDYFSRKIFASTTTTKHALKITKFLDKVYGEIPFEKLKSDNGSEFVNKDVEKWCLRKNVLHEKSVPYLYESNGRVERAFQTIRNGLKKEQENVKDRFSRSGKQLQ